MIFPLSLSDISLWLAVTSLVLLVTSELLISLPEYSRRVRIETKRMRLIAFVVGLAFLVTIAMRVVS
jgi:dipeptide/tripeptide permease